MDTIMNILAQVAYHALELIKAIGEIAGELSAIHFPPVA